MKLFRRFWKRNPGPTQRHKELQRKYGKLESDYHVLKRRSDNLDVTEGQLQRENKKLQADIRELKAEIARLEDRHPTLEEAVLDLRTELRMRGWLPAPTTERNL